MVQQIPVSPAAVADVTRGGGVGLYETAADLAYQRLTIVNVVFVGPRGAADRQWVLIDAGVLGSETLISGAAEARFGRGSRPAAIVLTHGHFDHVGALVTLADRWDVPVYAHRLERPTSAARRRTRRRTRPAAG
jgi:glyoxylase-like metal-dependent hydrolase (beta-lactamase superfamily II)